MKMRVLVSAVALACAQVGAAALEPVDYVVPLMGTDSEPALSAGNVYPDISRPWRRRWRLTWRRTASTSAWWRTRA